MNMGDIKQVKNWSYLPVIVTNRIQRSTINEYDVLQIYWIYNSGRGSLTDPDLLIAAKAEKYGINHVWCHDVKCHYFNRSHLLKVNPHGDEYENSMDIAEKAKSNCLEGTAGPRRRRNCGNG